MEDVGTTITSLQTETVALEVVTVVGGDINGGLNSNKNCARWSRCGRYITLPRC